MSKFVPKCAFITGATAGIGLATAHVFAAEKTPLILVGRRKERLQQIQSELQKKYEAEVETFELDISDRVQCESFVQQNLSLLKKIDLLVNNAGLAKGLENFQEAKLDDWDEMIDTNMKGLLYLTRLLIPSMIENQRGHIVNVGSVAGRWSYPKGAVYCATKFAVRAISESLRMDLFGTPLRVTNIEPGMVETEFSAVRLGDAERAKAVYKGMNPLTPVDIAESILWSVQRPAHVNIQELVIFPTDQVSIQQVYRR
ncbi:MAG: SDR family NAD(P)-dependent oxidoreductase [Bdellovibrionales bacterium]